MKEGVAIFIFALYHGVNIFLGWQNKQTVQKRLDHHDLRQIEHFLWGLMYAALIIPWFWVYDIWFVLALIPLHLSVFPVAYNLYRDLPAFNLSKTSKAITDRILVRMGLKSMESVCFGAEVLAIFLITISIRKL